MSRPWVRALVVPIGVLVAYFLAPLDRADAPAGVLVGVLVAFVALAGVVKVVADEARSAKRRLTGWQLTVALEIALVVFAFTYYLLARNDPEEFAGLSTRLDALYFATATAATVGYGDVHAVGQVSRGLVTLHMIFNIVFIAAVVNLVKDRMSARRSTLQVAPGEQPGSDAGRDA